MSPAPLLPEFSRLDGAAMECSGGRLFCLLASPANAVFPSGSYVTPGLSLTGETL